MLRKDLQFASIVIIFWDWKGIIIEGFRDRNERHLAGDGLHLGVLCVSAGLLIIFLLSRWIWIDI